MRSLLLLALLSLSSLLFAQLESASVKQISEHDNDLQIVLAVSPIDNNNKLNQVKSVIASQSTFQLAATEADFIKKTVELYFTAGSSTTIDQLERFISFLGISKLSYKDAPIQIEDLSEAYVPVVLDEYIIKTRN